MRRCFHKCHCLTFNHSNISLFPKGLNRLKMSIRITDKAAKRWIPAGLRNATSTLHLSHPCSGLSQFVLLSTGSIRVCRAVVTSFKCCQLLKVHLPILNNVSRSSFQTNSLRAAQIWHDRTDRHPVRFCCVRFGQHANYSILWIHAKNIACHCSKLNTSRYTTFTKSP